MAIFVLGEVTAWAVILYMGMVFRRIEMWQEKNQRFSPLALLPYISPALSLL